MIDGFLSPEALAQLRRFCWGSTIWRRNYENGYLGAFPETGFACPLLAQIAGRLRKANDVNADLVFSDLPGRVAKALLDLADRFGRTADDGIHVHHDLTQEELAQLVGASRETVNKALADFASRGWLRLEPRSVVIMEVDRLRRRAR